jgi:hypothetical protein
MDRATDFNRSAYRETDKVELLKFGEGLTANTEPSRKRKV